MTHTCFCTVVLLNAEVIWLPCPSVITSGLISGTRLAEEGLVGGGASGGFNGLICWTMTIPGVTVPAWPPLVVLTMPRPVPLDNARYDCDERTTLTSFLGRPGPRPYIKIVKTDATLLTVQNNSLCMYRSMGACKLCLGVCEFSSPYSVNITPSITFIL